ncbi:40S ribosomal protein S12-like isoform X1 [Populus alba x Populus x berolinensis]|uniref:40S ribosomal protein S12 n=1 Tax=Populus alba x Populus x berolinensis TaxID=444605 RepID=A0AAD6RJE7_9ROSI|nr:40S ribosomal protein S12-like isoform X1 [Populus alba x Populus x berolinensis]
MFSATTFYKGFCLVILSSPVTTLLLASQTQKQPVHLHLQSEEILKSLTKPEKCQGIEEAPAPAPAPAPAETPAQPLEAMDLMTALQLVLKKSLAHGGLARGLHEGAKVIEKHAAQLCVLAEDCNQPDYIKLVKALCADHGVGLLTVPSAKTLGEWAGLCKIDSEGKARKVVGCSCVVVKDYGETSEGYNVVQEHVKAH